jgi:DNA-binding MarR family transcriptional regulator
MQHPEIECACAGVRRAARLVTQLYDGELRPGLQASQFALLSVLDKRPGLPQSVLGRALAFDKTTLSRNLSLMRKKLWIEPAPLAAPGSDARERGFRLTVAGRKLLRAATPGWRRAQERLRSSMTAAEWDSMWQALRTLTAAASRAQNNPNNRQKGVNE